MKAVNLLPPDTRGVVKTTERTVVVDDSSSFGAFAVLGALALAVVAIAGVALLAGSAFGAAGEGYLRVSYGTSQAQLTEALRRLGELIPAL